MNHVEHRRSLRRPPLTPFKDSRCKEVTTRTTKYAERYATEEQKARRKAEKHRHYLKHREQVRAHVREYYAKNSEKACAQKREYASANRETIRDYNKDYRSRPGKRDHLLEKSRAWREQNAQYCIEAKREYRRQYPEKTKAAVRRYAAAHREEARQTTKRWIKEHPEQVRTHHNNRDARIRGAAGKHTVADVQAIWERQRHRCAVPNCEKPISEHGKDRFHVDHVIAVSRGGSNDAFNLQILCKFHNIQKHDLDPIEWAQRNGLLFC